MRFQYAPKLCSGCTRGPFCTEICHPSRSCLRRAEKEQCALHPHVLLAFSQPLTPRTCSFWNREQTRACGALSLVAHFSPHTRACANTQTHKHTRRRVDRTQVIIVDEADKLINSEGTVCEKMVDLRDFLVRFNPRIQFVLLSATFR